MNKSPQSPEPQNDRYIDPALCVAKPANVGKLANESGVWIRAPWP